MDIRRGLMLAVAWLSVLAVIMLAFIGLLWANQERVVFQPPSGFEPRDPGLVRFRADDGQPLLAFVVGDRQRARHLLITFHGNAEVAEFSVPWAEEVAQRTGWLVMVAEYRGYAGLPGTPTYAASRTDARATYAFARDSLGFPPERIALRGFSLGSAIAAELATEVSPAALVLEAPLSSARDMARIIIARPLHFVWERISRVHFDTERRVAEIDAPVWVAHGADDLTIPARMGRDVFAAAKVKGELFIVPDASHNEIIHLGGERYWQWLERALASGARHAARRGVHAGPPSEGAGEPPRVRRDGDASR